MTTQLPIGTICDGIATVLGAAVISQGGRKQTYSELTEGMNDWPTLQVYPEFWNMDARTDTDRHTFPGANASAPVRMTELTVLADLYARQRNDIAEDMTKLVQCVDAMVAKFEEQNKSPYFGVAGIKNWKVSGQRVNFVYGDQQIPYTGFRFTILIRTY